MLYFFVNIDNRKQLCFEGEALISSTQHRVFELSRAKAQRPLTRKTVYATVAFFISSGLNCSLLFSIANTILATFLVNAIIARPEPFDIFIV